MFTQFLDSTWQLMQQRPDAFEFNERFLLILHDHVMSCQFGTFIGNCEKDRIDLKLAERTYSLWGFMANHMNEYINALYRPGEDEDIVRPNLSPQVIKFWRGMYSRFESGVHPREDIGELLLTSKEHTASLEDHVQHLSKVKRFIEFKSSVPQFSSLYSELEASKILFQSQQRNFKQTAQVCFKLQLAKASPTTSSTMIIKS